MPHFVVAACRKAELPASALAAALKAQAQDPERPRLIRVTRLDLEESPRLNRLKTLLGIGWTARPLLERLAAREGAPVDAVIEICGCGRHHLLDLGQAGVPALRWIPAGAPGRPNRLDALAAREGTILAGGSVAYTESVPGVTIPCIPLPEDKGETKDEALAQRCAHAILERLEPEAPAAASA